MRKLAAVILLALAPTIGYIATSKKAEACYGCYHDPLSGAASCVAIGHSGYHSCTASGTICFYDWVCP